MLRVSQSESMAMCGVAIVMSGDEGFPWEGRRVGVSVLSSARSDSMMKLCKMSPRAAARESEVWEYQAGW